MIQNQGHQAQGQDPAREAHPAVRVQDQGLIPDQILDPGRALRVLTLDLRMKDEDTRKRGEHGILVIILDRTTPTKWAQLAWDFQLQGEN